MAGVWNGTPATTCCMVPPSIAPWGDRTQLASASHKVFNQEYEREGGVPLYDRGVDAPLSGAVTVRTDVRHQSLFCLHNRVTVILSILQRHVCGRI